MTDRWDELKHRVEAKKKELQAKLERAQADGIEKSSQAADEARQKLDGLDQTLKDGWDNVSDSVADRLNAWLK